MDLGVGAVMLTGALVRRPTAATRAGGGADRGAWRVCRRHAPLVGIGAARLLAVKAADYHEVVSEYGTPAGLDTPSNPAGGRNAPPSASRAPQSAASAARRPAVASAARSRPPQRRRPSHSAPSGTHWNFFFTLALVAAAAAVATPASARATALCGAALLLLHQAALSCGLAGWVEHAPRLGLLSANKVRPRTMPCAPARCQEQPRARFPAAHRPVPVLAGGAGLAPRLPRHLVAGRRARRRLPPPRLGARLVARPRAARPADGGAVGRRAAAALPSQYCTTRRA